MVDERPEEVIYTGILLAVCVALCLQILVMNHLLLMAEHEACQARELRVQNVPELRPFVDERPEAVIYTGILLAVCVAL